MLTNLGNQNSVFSVINSNIPRSVLGGGGAGGDMERNNRLTVPNLGSAQSYRWGLRACTLHCLVYLTPI